VSAQIADGRATVLSVVVDPIRLSAGIVDADGETLVRDRISTPSREVWRVLEQLVRRVLAAAPDEIESPRIVGASCTSPVDLTAGSVSPHLIAAWTAFPLREYLEDLTGLPVVLDTAAGALAEGERWAGDAVHVDSFLTLVVDVTVESAVTVGGVRLHGARGNAGSLAHVIVEPGGPQCWCGALGCLTAMVSATDLEREMNRPLRRATDTIIDRTGIMIGRALATSMAIFDVSTVFITGSVVDTFGDPLLEAVHREVMLRSRLTNLGGFALVELSGSVQPLVGAAALAFADRVTPR
jgi:glucokinase